MLQAPECRQYSFGQQWQPGRPEYSPEESQKRIGQRLAAPNGYEWKIARRFLGRTFVIKLKKERFVDNRHPDHCSRHSPTHGCLLSH